MPYDFPTSPAENDEFIPSGAGQTYIYKAPRWMVKGIPPIAGEGGGGGIDEAPVDGNQYARQDAAWSEVAPSGIPEAPTDGQYYVRSGLEVRWEVVDAFVSWNVMDDKPATFPPTLPIPWTDVSGKPSTYPPTLPIGWSDVSGKPATFPPTLPIAKSDVTDLPAELTYLHNMDTTLQTNIDGAVAVNTTQQTQINTNIADIATKANINSPTFTGDPKAPTPATADNDTSIATTAFVKAQAYVGEATADSRFFSRRNGAWFDSFQYANPLQLRQYQYNSSTTAPPASTTMRFDNATQQSATKIWLHETDLSAYDTSILWAVMLKKNVTIGINDQDDPAQKWLMYALTADAVDMGAYWELSVLNFGYGGAQITSGSRCNFVIMGTIAGGAAAVIADAAPAHSQGALWWNSANGNLYISYNDGSSTQWVQINSVGV